MNKSYTDGQIRAILAHVDHTLLRPDAPWEEVRALCDDAVIYHTASVCIAPSYVAQASTYLNGAVPICTVIGFPNGYNTTAVKCAEAADAVLNGADEIDMVINLGWVKDRRWNDLYAEIDAVKKACDGRLLKVIVETCLLTDEEKIRITEIVDDSDADFIKTSTGFSTAGATREDLTLFRDHIRGTTRIKAAGGIKTLDDAADFLELGADRLGTSRIVTLVKGD